MNKPATCPECGKPLPEGSSHDLCPACLMGQVMASQTLNTVAGNEAAAPPPTPEEIADKFPQFEVVECLGRGGMGVVYKARQKSLDRWVAIKVLAPERVHEERFAEHFEREAKTLAKMSHPNIVTVFDHGQTDGLFYIVMEFVDGLNLRDLLREAKMEPEQALAIIPPICDALEYAHDKGVVHRDIKPENILLDRDGRVKIADFGIASLVGASGEKSGTPPYMAPEQENGIVDRRADIYALGAVLYEMLTGERPNKELVAPSKKVQIDIRLDQIVLRALEKTPELRYQTAGEFRTVLQTMSETPPRLPTSQSTALLKSDRARVTWQDSPTAWMVAPTSGTIELFNDKLVVTSGSVCKEIPLASIQTLKEAVPPIWWSPGGHRYLTVEYDDGTGRKHIAFQAGAAVLRFVGDTKLSVAEWLSAIQRAVKSSTGREIEASPGIMRLPLAVTPISFLWLLLLVPLCVTLLGAVDSGAPKSIAGILLSGLPVMLLPLFILSGVLIVRKMSLGNKPLPPTVKQPSADTIPRVVSVESARKKTFPAAAIVGFALLLAALMAWLLLPRYEAWKQEKLRIVLQNELVDRIGTMAGGKGITFSKLTVVYGSPEAPSKAVVRFDGLQSRLGPANEPLAEPRKLKGEIVLIWQPPNEWSASGTGDLSGLAAVWHTAQRGFPNGLPLRESTQPSSDATHPFLRVTVRVLETHTGFDDSKLLRPASLLDDGEVKVLAARYIRVRSGNVTGIQIPEIPRLAQGGGHILSGRTKTLYIKPTLDLGSAHVRYTLEGDVRGDGAKAGSYERLPIRSDSLQLGEWQLMESNSDGGRKQLAVISVEMEQALEQSARFIRKTGGYQLGEGSIVLTASSDGKVTLAVTMVEGTSRDTNTVPDFCKKEGWFVYIENPKRVWIFDGIRQLDLLTPGGRNAGGASVRAGCPAAVWDAVPESVRKFYLEPKVAVQSATAEAGESFSFGAAHELTLPMNEDGLTRIFDLGEGQNATYDNGAEYTIESLTRMQAPGLAIRQDKQAGRLIFYGISGAGIELVRRPDLQGDQWEKITDREALELLQRNVMSLGGSVSMETRDILPQTCFFKTGTNLLGILQVTGFTEDGRGLKIRYKLVRNVATKEDASAKPSAFKPIPAEAARLMEEIRQVHDSPEFMNLSSDMPEVVKRYNEEINRRLKTLQELLRGTRAEALFDESMMLAQQIRDQGHTGDPDLRERTDALRKQLEDMLKSAGSR